MKANVAPEKLYLHPTANGKVAASWLTFPLTDEDIEYIRTDVFIEKASEWIYETLRNTDFYENEIELMINDFKKSMKL